MCVSYFCGTACDRILQPMKLAFNTALSFNTTVTDNDVVTAAVGCSNLVAPSEGAWLRREGDDVIVGCYASRQSWQLHCVDGVWTGTVGLCPQQQHHNDQQFIDSNGGEILHVSVTYVFDI